MNVRVLLLLGTALAALAQAAAPPPPATPTDALGRTNPRGAVTGFLEACHQHDYPKAAQYIDLSGIAASRRATQGPVIARDLESVLNSDSHFNVLALSQSPQGNPGDDPDPNIEHVATVESEGGPFTLELKLETQPKGPSIWLFAPKTASEVPKLVPVPSAAASIEARLPRFLVTTQILDTALWKWIALVLMAVVIFGIFRLIVHLSIGAVRRPRSRVFQPGFRTWLGAILEPLLVLVAVIAFGITVQFINPSALARLYIGRFLLMVFVGSIAWSLMNLFDLFLRRIDVMLDPRQRMVAHSLIYLARRVVKVLIVGFAAIIVLDNWNIRMTTVIAGLGVGGIAVALAAQQTIANVFGGVSVIGDAPVMIGDFGSFGGVIGTIEEIGMRSARVRTLNRTVVSIPNSSFATANLENYALRDKILFNPTFQIKRGTPKDKIREAMQGLHEMLATTSGVEIGPTPVRISAYSAAAFTIELFAYVLTSDIDQFYKRQAELYLKIDEVVTNTGVELA